MRRVLIIVAALDGGGVENVLLNYLKHFDFDKYSIDFVVHGHHVGKLEDEFKRIGCGVVHVPSKHDGLLKNIFTINSLIKNGKYDVVHTNMGEMGFSHMISAWIYKVPIRILHTHTIFRNQTKPISLLLRYISKSFSNKWIACSADAAISMFGKKAQQKKVIILKNAIETDRYQFNEEIRIRIQTELNLSGKYVIGIVGRLSEEKNYPFSLMCFQSILNKCPDAFLLIIGGGELLDSLKNLIESMGIADRVSVLGLRDDVPDLLKAMDVFMLPSISEGFGMAFVEAQCSGLPCYASDRVPRDTQLTSLMHYLPLEMGAEKWAEVILELKDAPSVLRSSYAREVKEAGYDVETQVRYLEMIYLGAVF